jgi:hypothetical protein
MSATVSADAVAAIRADARRAAATGFSLRRLWQRVGAIRTSCTDREMSALVYAIGHAGVIADFEQARSNR